MSAHKITRDTYKQIYDELIKVIKEDPHLSNTYNLQEEHVEYLERVIFIQKFIYPKGVVEKAKQHWII